MRAAWYERQGAPEDVLQIGSLDLPEPAAGEVRVRIHASGVNPSDTYGRSGRQAPMAFARIIPHQDGSGVTTIHALKPDGVVASYATRGDPEPKIPFRSLMVKNLTVRAILVYTMSEAAKTAASQDITRTLESGAMRPVIGQRLRLEDVAQAHTDVERG